MLHWLVLLIALWSFSACSAEKTAPSQKKEKWTAAGLGDAAKPNAMAPHDSAAKKQKSVPVSQKATDLAGKHGWTMFRGNRRRTGAADVAGPTTANLKWVFRTGGRIYADAAVSTDGQTVYVASHDHSLYAVDTDGRKKWSFDTGGKIWTSPAISDDGRQIYVGSDEDALFALSSNGKMNWKFVTRERPQKGEAKPEAGRFDVDTSPLLLDDGTIVFGCHLKLIALRPAAGDLRWAFAAGVGSAKVFSSAAQSLDGTIFFGTQGDYFFAINHASNVLWSKQTGGDNDSTPVVDIDGTVYFASDDGIVRSVASGNVQKWQVKLGSAIRAPLGLSTHGTLYVSTYGPTPFVAALDKNTGKEKWRFHIEPGIGDFYGIQSGVTTDSAGRVYFGGRDGYVYCLDSSGKLIWKHRTDDQVDASPVLGPDGTLYIGSDDGRLYAFAR
ncbi:MAG: PQQ-like beta-propeller repeat protein [Deltaproteobacteria bacterium]|nr:PQQ-like beta-propeller repeat protein [Deltaproteobacteria bacterium]